VNRVGQFALCMLLGASHASAQEVKPFGLRMGMSAAEVQRLTGAVVEKDDRFYYSAKTVPSPHAAFEAYGFIISPTLGLCKISAIGKDLAPDAYGSEARRVFGDLADAITAKYGSPSNEFDFLKAGSIWDEGRDWAMAVKQNERTLSKYWGTEGKSLLDPLRTIGLSVHATSSTNTYVTLTYDFKNIDRCVAERDAAKNAIL
jgi:hypothetical protein